MATGCLWWSVIDLEAITNDHSEQILSYFGSVYDHEERGEPPRTRGSGAEDQRIVRKPALFLYLKLHLMLTLLLAKIIS